ncbi:MAG: 50S ribosomal protein L29 [Chlamydiales bacterium]
MNKVEKFRSKSNEELDLDLETFRKELFDLRSERLDSKTQKTHLFRQTRKQIARILTIKKERSLKKD